MNVFSDLVFSDLSYVLSISGGKKTIEIETKKLSKKLKLYYDER